MNFEKYLNAKFQENPPKRSPIFSMRTEGRTDGETDRHDEAKSSFPQFCEILKREAKICP